MGSVGQCAEPTGRILRRTTTDVRPSSVTSRVNR